MKKLIRIGWLFFIIVVIILTLFGCVPVKYHKDAQVMVMHNGKGLSNNDLLLGREQEIFFSFLTGKSEGLTPKVYVYGPISVDYYPKTDVATIRSDVGHKIKTKFTRPGEAIIMFIWESESAFSDSITIYLKYDN